MNIVSSVPMKLDFRLEKPCFLNRQGRGAPYLILDQNATLEIMKFGVDTWESLISLPKQPSEQLIPYYSHQFGLEIMVRSIDPATEERRIKEKIFFDENGLETNRFHVDYIMIFGYLPDGTYLCLETQNGNIMCKNFKNECLWKTQESYICPDDYTVTIHDAEIHIYHGTMHYLRVYGMDGTKVTEFKTPANFVGCGQTAPIIQKKDNMYYMEGFIDDYLKYARIALGQKDSPLNILFTLDKQGFNEFERHENYMLLTAIGDATNRNGNYKIGDLCILIDSQNDYKKETLFFKAQSDTQVGGGHIQWVDSLHFLYWNIALQTKLYLYNISGKLQSKLDKLGSIFDIAVAGKHIYIMSYIIKSYLNYDGSYNIFVIDI